jgi:branched-chain amino acid transport system permease protein
MRESASASMALGKNPTYLKSWSFVIAGALAGLAGGMFASYISYIGSDSFGNSVNILIFAMVIVGGVGTIWGPVLGAMLLTVMPAALSLLSIPANILGPVEQVIYGALLVLIVLFRPTGLYGIFGRRRATSSEGSAMSEEALAGALGQRFGALERGFKALADTTAIQDD